MSGGLGVGGIRGREVKWGEIKKKATEKTAFCPSAVQPAAGKVLTKGGEAATVGFCFWFWLSFMFCVVFFLISQRVLEKR